MKKLGVSIFFGLGQTERQNIAYLELVRSCGYTELFTSLHIPETDPLVMATEARRVLFKAAEMGFAVTADISSNSWELFGFRPSEMKKFGIHQLRIDFGLSPQKIRELADLTGLDIQVNASTTSAAGLADLLAAGIGVDNLSAGHNYYPRPETGLSYDLFVHRSALFASAGISLSAFIPCHTHARGPIYAGLPTLESHRYMNPLQSAKQLLASGLLDSLFFSDPLVSEQDLWEVRQLPSKLPEPLQLQVKFIDGHQRLIPIILGSEHTNRVDASAWVVRSQQSRNLFPFDIVPQSATTRPRGSVTIDNINYGRYMGELQIVLREMPADGRVNVIGSIAEEDLCFLDCLIPGRTFCLREADRE